MKHSEAALDAYERLALDLAAYAVAEIAGRHVGADERSTKADASDWVTIFDVRIERRVREAISNAFPDHAIVGEELGSTGQLSGGGFVWYVDPIDGTTNFVHGLPWSSFSLALADDEGIVLGVVADPHRREVFSARRSGGARVNGEAAHCQEATGLVGGAVLAELAGVDCWPGFFDMLSALSAKKCVSRVMGSSALSLASVGAGRASAVVLAGWNPIDVAAGVLIARESGALVLAGPSAHPALGADGLRRDLLVAVVPGVAAELKGILEGPVGI
jgi:fructose-1,6-bisphosphatase/inositol monophosphatase family enzyme